MIINEMSGSGGDALPWMFKQDGVGPLVGTRTWGGLVGIYGYPALIDGGFVTAPRVAIYGLHGQWEVENHGIAPDIEVENDPASVAAGHDPQLEKAVQVTLEALKKNPVVLPEASAVSELSKDTGQKIEAGYQGSGRVGQRVASAGRWRRKPRLKAYGKDLESSHGIRSGSAKALSQELWPTPGYSVYFTSPPAASRPHSFCANSYGHGSHPRRRGKSTREFCRFSWRHARNCSDRPDKPLWPSSGKAFQQRAGGMSPPQTGTMAANLPG